MVRSWLDVAAGWVDAWHFARSSKRLRRQFVEEGFAEATAPPIDQLLPLRYPELVRGASVRLFEKEQTQILVFSTYFTPRTRLPHRPRLFALMVLPMGDGADLGNISGGVREPSEIYSFMDLLTLDSYPSISPVPDAMIFAADEESARRVIDVLRQHQQMQQRGSMLLHGGRLMFQMPVA